METSDEPLSERLQGIADSLTVRAATLLAQHTRARLPPELMDELRHWAGVAVRGAAIEATRRSGDAFNSLSPAPMTAPAVAREMAMTRNNNPPKLPGGV